MAGAQVASLAGRAWVPGIDIRRDGDGYGGTNEGD